MCLSPGYLSLFEIISEIICWELTASFSLSVLFPPLCFSLIWRLRETSEPYVLSHPLYGHYKEIKDISSETKRQLPQNSFLFHLPFVYFSSCSFSSADWLFLLQFLYILAEIMSICKPSMTFDYLSEYLELRDLVFSFFLLIRHLSHLFEQYLIFQEESPEFIVIICVGIENWVDWNKKSLAYKSQGNCLTVGRGHRELLACKAFFVRRWGKACSLRGALAFGFERVKHEVVVCFWVRMVYYDDVALEVVGLLLEEARSGYIFGGIIQIHLFN